jgi:SAM-dependent methyltransferase
MQPTDWWNTRLQDKRTFDFFVKNLGDANMPSRIAAREMAAAAGMKDVLDVGCGPALDRWHDSGLQWMGCDGSQLLVDYNANRGVSIDLGPADKLPYLSGHVDLVYSRHVWEHLPHYLSALKEACRVARSGVMVTFFIPPGLSETKIEVRDGAYYNRYCLADIRVAFEREWPGCKMVERSLGVQKFLPFGETILLVTR